MPIPLLNELSFSHMESSNINASPTVLENQQLKFKLDMSAANCFIATSRLCEYILLLKNTEARLSGVEAKCKDLEEAKSAEMEKMSKEIKLLQGTCAKYEAEAVDLRKEVAALTSQIGEPGDNCPKRPKRISLDMEFKPVYRSPEEMMKTRFDILAQLPIPEDNPADILRPLEIPERFTIHEFLLGSASGSLRNALSGYCAFTENTTMWCPQREEHGFYLTPLYKCDSGPRSNVIHRWSKVDIKARMPKPTECFYKKDGEWYYTGTYQALRLEDLTPKEYDNLSQATRDALVKETLAGRKNPTPQVFFETAQLYAAGALKVAVVGIQCVGFNRMLYSVALQQAQRFQSHPRGKGAVTKDPPEAVAV